MLSVMLDWRPLEHVIEGEVALPGSPAYEASRRSFNTRFHEVAPEAFVSCVTPQDASEAVSFARQHGLEIAMRSGGHSFAGHSSTQGLVIDGSPMRSVAASGGVATVGAGARLGEVYDALQEEMLAVPAGTCPSVGVAGLTLGGGLGILGRKYGVTSDHMVGAEIVLADGRILACDEHHADDLFWALRGAGAGNFGVVTSLVLRTVPAPDATNVPSAGVVSQARSSRRALIWFQVSAMCQMVGRRCRQAGPRPDPSGAPHAWSRGASSTPFRRAPGSSMMQTHSAVSRDES
jgi:FAD/FMN-containing dehydrogenase